MHYVDSSLKGFISTADTSATSNIGLAVKLDAAGQAVLATAATDNIVGTLTDGATAGRVCQVRLRSCTGTLNVQAGAAIAKDAPVTSNATGQAIVTAVAGNQIIGYALEAASGVGQIIEVMPSTAKFQ